jgi:hypothetical protein
MGGGEGTQLEGAGHYFSTDPRSHAGYKRSFTNARIDREFHPENHPELKDMYTSDPSADVYDMGIWNKFKDKLPELYKAHEYDVGLNVNPEDLLHWDKPLKEHSDHIQNVAANLMTNKVVGNPLNLPGQDLPNFIRETLYDKIMGQNYSKDHPAFSPGLGTEEKAHYLTSKALEAMGIPGMKYPSHNKTGKNPNYVIWHDKAIDILKKYGLIGMIGSGALSQMNKENK